MNNNTPNQEVDYISIGKNAQKIYEQLKANEPVESEPSKEQGAFGDTVDAFQRGMYQGAAGLAEFGHQVTDSETLGNVRDWANTQAHNQLEEMSATGKEALNKPFFEDDGTGGVKLGEGMTDPRAWAMNLSMVAGQYVDILAGGGAIKGITTLGKIALKTNGKKAFKKAAQDAIDNGASPALAEQAGKNALQKLTEKYAGAATYGAVGGSMATGMSGISVREEIREMDYEDLSESEEYQRIYWNEVEPRMKGATVKEKLEQARLTLAERAASSVQKDPLLLTSNFATELVGGRFLDSLVRGVGGTGKRFTNMGKQAATEGTTEAIQGGVEAYAQNITMQEYADPDRNVMEGVAANALTEGVLGGTVGGLGGAIRSGKHEATENQVETDQPEVPDYQVTDEQIESIDPLAKQLALPQSRESETNAEDVIHAGQGETWSAPRLEDLDSETLRVPAVDQSQVAGNKNDGLDQQPAKMRRAPVNLPFGNEINFETANAEPENSLSLIGQEEQPSIPFEPVSRMDDLAEKVSGLVQANESNDVEIPATANEQAVDADFEINEEVNFQLAQAANEAATSPNNDLPEPTQAQKEAGNYKKGHVKLHGLEIAIENPKGSSRSGVDPDGNEWSVEMKSDYGYIKRTEGADGDQVDVFIGKYPESEKVFVIDQIQKDGSFDEHKVMMGFKNKAQAIHAYKSNYEKGWKVGPVTQMSVGDFRSWLKHEDLKAPIQTVQKAHKNKFGKDKSSQLEDEAYLEVNEPNSLYSGYERKSTTLQNEKSDLHLSEPIGADEGQRESVAVYNSPEGEKRKEFADLFGTVVRAEKVSELRAASDTVKSKDDLAHLLSSIRKEAQETFIAVVTNGDGKVLRVMRHTKGVKDASNVDPLIVVAEAASIPDAATIHFGHNHPSGKPTPSHADEAVTDQIFKLLDGTGIQPGHHVVIGDNTWAGVANAYDSAPATGRLPPRIRRVSVPMTERRFAKRGQLGNAIQGPDTAMQMTKNHSNAIFLLDSQNAPVAVIPLSSSEMNSLRQEGRVNRILKAIDKSNASAAIIKATGSGGIKSANNAAKMLSSYGNGMRVLDAIVETDSSLMSLAQIGQLKTSGPFYSLEKENPNNALGNILASINEQLSNDPAKERDFYLAHAKNVKDWISATKKELNVDVEVIPTANQLPFETIVRLSMNGYLPRVKGVYENGKMYLVANRLSSESEAVAVTLHEALGHHGVMSYLGDELEPTIKEIAKGLGKKPLASLAADYDLDLDSESGMRVAVLEYIAHAAETGKRLGLVKKLIAAIKAAIRKLFPSSKLVSWTDTDVLALIDRARIQMTQKDVKNAKPDTLASLNKSLQLPKNQKAKVSKFIDDVLNENVPPSQVSVIDNQSSVLRALGIEAPHIVMSSAVVRKAVDFKYWRSKFPKADDGKHSLSPKSLKTAIGALYNPVLIFDSDTQSDAFVALSESFDDNNNPVVVAIHANKSAGRRGEYRINQISSIHGRTGGFELLNGWIQKGLLRYVDKNKARSWSTDPLLHLQSGEPPIASHARGSKLQSARKLDLEFAKNRDGHKIITKSDVVKLLHRNDTGPLARLASATSDHFDDLSDDAASFLNKIGRPTVKQRAIQRLKEALDGWRLKVRQGLVDRYAALLDLDRQVHGSDVVQNNTTSSSWVRARLSSSAAGVVSSLMNGGRVFFDSSEDVIGVRENTNGLIYSLNKLGTAAEVERFMGWVAANRASKLAAEGRENLFSSREINAGKGLNAGSLEDGRNRNEVYQAVFREFQQHRDDVLSIAENAGIITPENRSMWRDEFYVPFYRVMEEDNAFNGPVTTGGLSRQQAYKKLKGGNQELNDLLQNTILNFHHLIDASLKNISARYAIDNAVQAGVATQIPESQRSKQSTFVLREGQKTWYDIEDPLVFNAITSLSSLGMNGTAMKVMRSFKRVFTNFTTASPQFMIANLIRDSLHAVSIADLKANPVGNVVKGMKSYLTDYERARLNATGGAFNFGHVFGEDAQSIKWNIDKELRKGKVIRSPKQIPTLLSAMWDRWQSMGNVLENVNRASVYKQNEHKGKLFAAYQARDLMPFDAHGAWPAVRVLIDIVPFLNARLQGLDKMWREGVKPSAKMIRQAMGMGDASISDRKAALRFNSVVGALAVASIALYLHNRDDEDYKNLEDWQKDTYWFIKVGSNAQFLPKPFEVGALATFAERLTEQFVDDKATGELFVERLKHMFLDTFSFSPVPQLVQPALDVYANKNSFTGRDIETMSMERLSPSMRINGRTTEAAKLLSKGLEKVVGKETPLSLSPVQLDYLVSGYLGWLGSTVVGGSNVIASAALGKEEPHKHWYEYQPVRRFYKNLDLPGHSKIQTQFYDSLREVNQIYSDIRQYRKQGETEAALKLASENKDKLKVRRLLARVQKKLSAINARMRVIENSNKDAIWKRRELDRLKLLRQRILNQVSAYSV